jgi:hypothetical protein
VTDIDEAMAKAVDIGENDVSFNSPSFYFSNLTRATSHVVVWRVPFQNG